MDERERNPRVATKIISLELVFTGKLVTGDVQTGFSFSWLRLQATRMRAPKHEIAVFNFSTQSFRVSVVCETLDGTLPAETV
jgi:hypothetical protein